MIKLSTEVFRESHSPQAIRFGSAILTHALPPAADHRNREIGSIVADAISTTRLVVRYVIPAVWQGIAEFLA